MFPKINRNQAFFIGLSIVAIALIIIYIMAEKQNMDYWQDYQASEKAVEMLSNNQNQQAGEILEDLLPRHPESYQISWYYAIYLANIREYQKAQDYYDRALVLFPDLKTNEVFLLRCGENFYHLGQVEKAKQYLQQCNNTSTNPEIKKEAERILEKIQNGE